jgi:hypothetical protein
MTERVTILDAMADPNLFAASFRNTDSWAAWRVFLCALFGLPMTPEQLLFLQTMHGA